MKVVAVDGLINMFKDARARLNPRDYHSLVEYDTRDTMFLNFIQMLQLADGVELVKCEDCKHWYSDADCGMACEFTNMSQPNDGYCNWGVPKQTEREGEWMTYTEKELNQFLHGISLSLLSKKSAQHWRYDEETAKEIEWLEALERKVRADKADRKDEPTGYNLLPVEDEPQTERSSE